MTLSARLPLTVLFSFLWCMTAWAVRPPSPNSVEFYLCEPLNGLPAKVRTYEYYGFVQDVYYLSSPEVYEINTILFDESGRVMEHSFSEPDLTAEMIFTPGRFDIWIWDHCIEQSQVFKTTRNSVKTTLVDLSGGKVRGFVKTFRKRNGRLVTDTRYFGQGDFNRAYKTTWYGKNGLPERSEEWHAKQEYREEMHSYLEFDEKGNWTTRMTLRLRKSEDPLYIFTVRNIEYLLTRQ